jgi:hypothetical protein
MVGVDARIVTYGEKVKFRQLRRIHGWDYSIEDMKKFGVDNVQEIGGPWNWHRLRPEIKVVRVKVNALRKRRTN